MEQNKEKETEVTEVMKPSGNEIAMEILKHEQDKSKAKNIGMIGMAIGIVSLAIATAVIVIHLTNVNYKNDCDWRKLFDSYDFITQDGGGENYYNSEIGGNANNGATSDEKKE